MNQKFTEIGRRALQAKGLSKLAEAYDNPDKNPDLPFLWRSTEWAKSGGLLTFALPARIFGRSTGKGFEAWKSVLTSISVTGLLNGADLRWSKVWEDIKVPFCVLFARNSIPHEDHRFIYATPLNEPDQNRQARFRIDYETAQAVSVIRVKKQPWTLKTLSLGTWRDVELIERLLSAFPRTLEEEWLSWNPAKDKSEVGYNLSKSQKQDPSMFLGPLLDFVPREEDFAIQYHGLNTYAQNHGTKTAHRPRAATLYQPPLVIIPQSPGRKSNCPRAYYSTRALAFSQSFYGYSCAGYSEADALASLLYLLPHSILFAYFCLMTSRRTGFDRLTFNKQELDALPFPDVRGLPSNTKLGLRRLAHRLQHEPEKPWGEIDSFLFRLYGLGEDAVQLAKDTLFSAMAYRRRGAEALDRTDLSTRASFSEALRRTLEPFFDVAGQHVVVAELQSQPDPWAYPWSFLGITGSEERVSMNPTLLRRAMEEANKRSASRIIIKTQDHTGLVLGLLNQRRWWTCTRAQLCAQHILRNHLDAFDLTSGSGLNLTDQERQVLELLALHKTNHEIAAQLSIGLRTLEAHKKRIMKHLHAKSGAELLENAAKHGLLTRERR